MQLYHWEPQVRVLGPGVRFGLWLQGCPFRCPGCLVPESWSKTGGIEMTPAEVAELILKTPGIDGVTITGGEPLLQRRELGELLQLLRRERPSLNYLLYTGYRWEELIELSEIESVLSCVDLIVDGEYREELNSGVPLRGSENQRLIPLSPVGWQIAAHFLAVEEREVELFLRERNGKVELFWAGIPPVGWQF